MSKNSKKPNYGKLALGSLAATFLFGWVLPQVPYTHRLTRSKAESLFDEYGQLIVKQHQESSLSATEQQRRDEIERTLTKAGWRYSVNIASGEALYSLRPPKYAESSTSYYYKN